MNTIYLGTYDATPRTELGRTGLETIGLRWCIEYYETIVKLAKLEDKEDAFSNAETKRLLDKLAFILAANHAEEVLYGLKCDVDFDTLYSNCNIDNAILLKMVARFGTEKNQALRQQMALEIADLLSTTVKDNFIDCAEKKLADDIEVMYARDYLTGGRYEEPLGY